MRATPFHWSISRCICFDPSSDCQFSLVETKCPCKYCQVNPQDASEPRHSAASSLQNVMELVLWMELKLGHPYYSQIQGQQAGVILLYLQ